MLKIEHLTKKFGEKVAVDDLSITVENGQICAFIGHNGAGKTTTLKAIAGIITFDKGTIEVNGVDVVKNPFEAKAQIAYLPDNPDLYEHLKGIDYLNFIADVFNLSSQERKDRIEYYAKKLEIYNDLSSLISSYSHGMKQKLALVSALIHNPKLLLLDEPFVGLDPISSYQFKLILQDLANIGVTIFYSTHVLDVAEKICTHVAIIKNGKLIVHDTMEKVKGMDSLENIFLELENEKHD
ncbi:MAG TPA: ABC transporter ATP-binding protein [Candidatus Onthoplasma faecigallinarum]|nr:ABC transporter ATP-binding protein [Candidatus Onthoplasma faecigallinarum]